MGEFGKCLFGGLSSFYEIWKPSLAMILVQICYAGLNILSKIALNQGMSHFVLVFYRHLVATIVTAPLAYILERNTRPKLTIKIFGEFFISSLFGISLNQNFYNTGLTYTSATFSTALLNLVPAITFLMAIVFRMESLSIRSLAGQAKIVGTLICLSGAMTMTFYKGIKIQLWPSPFHLSQYNKSNHKTEDLTKGSLLVVMGCISYSAWFILQTRISKKYPFPYSSTAITSFLVSIQCAVITLIFERGHYGVWVLGWNVNLLTAIYSGVIGSGVAFCLMVWCVEKKGPVFTAMFYCYVWATCINNSSYIGVIGAILIVTAKSFGTSVYTMKAENTTEYHVEKPEVVVQMVESSLNSSRMNLISCEMGNPIDDCGVVIPTGLITERGWLTVPLDLTKMPLEEIQMRGAHPSIMGTELEVMDMGFPSLEEVQFG
ncbi:WAT1-related protein At2g39510-like [Cryptomeria japonica]|uniref:WAT1-related protein At2g39510-like n=1 Tax=Cryptomeria japonica TaxID=3369 RepID=UPI0027DA987E|nr:WAT1-related protein At2g39510-like [Cryptomeria japonica]